MQKTIQSCWFNVHHSALSVFLIKSFIPFVDAKKEPAQIKSTSFLSKTLARSRNMHAKGNTLFHSSLIYPHMLTLRGLGYFSTNAQFHWLNGSTYRVNNFVFLSSTKATGCGASSSPSFLPLQVWTLFVGEVLRQA